MKRVIVWAMVALVLLTVPVTAAGQEEPVGEDRSFLPPYSPNAIFGQRVIAARITSDTFLDEPIAMLFSVVGFSSVEEASQAFQPFADHYLESARQEIPDNFRDYTEVSIGRLGDDRVAYLAEAEDITFGSSAKDVHVVIRVGPNIMYLWSVSLGGEAIEFLASYLDGFLSDATDDPSSLLPTVSDLPIGWQTPMAQPEDILSQIVATPTPTPTPTVSPTSTPSPTPTATPSPTPTPSAPEQTIEALSDELARTEADLAEARATVEVLEAATVAPSGLSPESVQLTVQVDLGGVISGDRDAVDDAEVELERAFGPYLDDPNCTIGFVMISSRSNELGQGVELSNAIASLLQETFPSLISAGSDELLSQSIALPGTQPVGEVQMEVFFYDACGVLAAS